LNWKTFLMGVSTGIAAGIALRECMAKRQTVSAETALTNAKAAFKKHGPIQGSWIQMEKQPYKKSFLDYEVYIGGISRLEDNETVQYEFIADSKTGTILDAYLLN
jgi:predicted small secreted protein